MRIISEKKYNNKNSSAAHGSTAGSLLRTIATVLVLSMALNGVGCGAKTVNDNNETKSLAGRVDPVESDSVESAEQVESGVEASAGQAESGSEDNASATTVDGQETVTAAEGEEGRTSAETSGPEPSSDLTAPNSTAYTETIPETVPVTDAGGDGNRTEPEDRDELIDALKKAVKQTESLETYHIHTVTTVTEATSSGETSSVTELGAHIVNDGVDPMLLATGTVTAFERSYSIEFYFKDGIIYQNIAGVKRSKPSSIDSALRSVSGSLWYPAQDSIDTISSYDAGNGMTRYLINIKSEDPSSRSYAETFVKSDGYVDSQHFVTQTVSGDKAGSSSDKWVTYTLVEGDFMPVFPDFSEYVME